VLLGALTSSLVVYIRRLQILGWRAGGRSALEYGYYLNFVSAGLVTWRWNILPSGGDHSMLNWILERMYSRARGQGMLEYALIIALVAVVVIAALVLLGPQIANIFNQVNNNL
jgi:pilus assembly protein Flp/PilA